MTKRKHPHPSDSDGDLFADLFADVFEPKLPSSQEVSLPQEQPELKTKPKPVLTMPDRGHTWSEEYRRECELAALYVYQANLFDAEFDALWEKIARARGQAAAADLRIRFDAFVKSYRQQV
jgi:hypothetical protein